MPRLPLVISLLTVRALFGQSIPVDPQNPAPNSVVQLKRTPAPQASTPQKTDTFVDHFRFRRERSGAGAVDGDACHDGCNSTADPRAVYCTRGLPAYYRRCAFRYRAASR